MYSNVVLVIELIITLAQITASVVVLAISWDTTRKSPLDGWIIGYTVGCVATLPLLYWRYRHRYVRQPEQPVDSLVSFSRVSLSPSAVTSTSSGILHSGVSTSANNDGVGDGSSRNLSSASGRSASGGASSRIDDSRFRRAVGASGGVPSLETVIAMDGRQRVVFSRLHDDTRLVLLVERFKILLDGFFAVWFVVGNVWMFGSSHESGHADSVYWLCLVFLVFSFIGYAMPFILCATICCCLPCIIALMGYTEEPMAGKGAAQETITRLPIYKFHSSAPDPEEVPILRTSGQQGRGAGRGETGDIEAGKDSDSDNESVPITGGFLVDSSAKKPVSAEDAMCCICLGRYTEGVELRLLPCEHHFHVPCVDTWLKINAICPLCKKEIVSQDTPTASSAESPQGSGAIRAPNASGEPHSGTPQAAAPGTDNRWNSDDPPPPAGRDMLDIV
ncbi:hypothetical protein CBR_g4866 [Chara braunii]|uniref:RING-type domain-containing protein n=1 Tax=Chara braunii TaxID=69332 RepID=A0A388KJ61_CHABU|nr:hypothetical protein CBR_g4866 [Chara braunii]|eukprot:GBG70038.1 hypothetical protein CBR_g4866 [Chara braunii]